MRILKHWLVLQKRYNFTQNLQTYLFSFDPLFQCAFVGIVSPETFLNLNYGNLFQTLRYPSHYMT